MNNWDHENKLIDTFSISCKDEQHQTIEPLPLLDYWSSSSDELSDYSTSALIDDSNSLSIISGSPGCWNLIREGSRRKTKSGKRNDILIDPEGFQYTKRDKSLFWQCTQTLIDKKRCNQQVIETVDPQQQSKVIGYEYDPRTKHGEHLSSISGDRKKKKRKANNQSSTTTIPNKITNINIRLTMLL